jgi:hypothetical protein
MKRATTAKTTRPDQAHLDRLQRQFLLAREQLAAQGPVERYLAVRNLRASATPRKPAA